MPGQDTPNLLAAGTIRPNRFVKSDGSADNKALECEAGECAIGITDSSTLGAESDNHATTTAGDDSVKLQNGRIQEVECGGTVTRGNFVGPDADGKAVQGGGCQAVALESGTTGAIIRVYTTFGIDLYPFEDFTADATLTCEESGKVCSNLAATGAVTITLPQDAYPGVHFKFTVAAAQQLRIDPGAAGAMIFGGAKQTDDRYIWADDEGESIEVIADGNGDWRTAHPSGTWTVQTAP